MTADEIFKPYAEIAMTCAKQLKAIQTQIDQETHSAKKAILGKQIKTIKHLIDRCIRVTGDFVPAHKSRAAQQYCEENGLGDISKVSWSHQTKFERQKNRKECTLIHEHKIPVSKLVEEIINAQTVDEVIHIFKNQEIVWITKNEDKKLPRTKRPDPKQAYEGAEIHIVPNNARHGALFGI